MKLSDRMAAVAALVNPGGILADVGTDHGYIPIFLVEQKIVPRAIAMDLREGPLERAKHNVRVHGLEDRIEARLSDGVSALQKNEADSILIAGMGGALIVHILSQGSSVCRAAGELILQPQSDLRSVRRYLRENGYITCKEDMVCEEGKFYSMMRAVPKECRIKEQSVGSARKILGDDICDDYGAGLIDSGHPVLADYLAKEHGNLVKLLGKLQAKQSVEAAARRLEEIKIKLRANERTQAYMENKRR